MKVSTLLIYPFVLGLAPFIFPLSLVQTLIGCNTITTAHIGSIKHIDTTHCLIDFQMPLYSGTAYVPCEMTHVNTSTIVITNHLFKEKTCLQILTEGPEASGYLDFDESLKITVLSLIGTLCYIYAM